VTCHNCQRVACKFGFNPQGLQRYRCKQCGKTFSDIPARPLDDLRVSPDKAFIVINLLCEGTGIRACERLAQLNRRTILGILETAGRKCAKLLDARVGNVQAEQVQVDELWSFVYCKQANAQPFTEHGDQYTFLAIDRDSKLIISHLVGIRSQQNAYAFMGDLKNRMASRFQLTTDGLPVYTDLRTGAVKVTFGSEIDYGSEIKVYGNDVEGQRRYSAPPIISVKRKAHIGNPDRSMINTSHAGRTNLSVRIFNRLFTRLTLGYSKKLANLKFAVALFVAHFNFCRVHSAHRVTPAMSAGLTDHVWTVEQLLSAV
jgi:transposase-like protein/IS1 family transposase